ncbi:pyridoxamine 5'-phosphate oxidase family protein [Frankia sp. Ag45/Mut15]|uniref:Pyridoxamine 5'-phosphate oxidase family protein n=1 Tax=Frankia umida TaxID=573489 RepID=A0ABT0JYR6_9ACTN|nr:pyridoxamine 5'-phosphate oxidase family protein [Frankia umida]MCK9876690.1 pyridoxamine 5'-phosphate oxidase family protein [Frankia umida]
MTISLRVEYEKPGSAAVLKAARKIFSEQVMLTMASVSPEVGVHANSAFFAIDEEFVVWFVSEATTRHSRNLHADARVAASIFLDTPEHGEQLRGVQFFGTARKAAAAEVPAGLRTYRQRFPTFAQTPQAQRLFLDLDGPSFFYRFEVASLTLLDEPAFGRRVYLSATVER